MTELFTNTTLSEGLVKQRQRWIAAYRIKDIATLDAIEAKAFFVVHYQNVEKKADWHTNILSISNLDDPLLALNEVTKTRYDRLSDTMHVITSYFKHSNNSTVIKEMWVFEHGEWHLDSLALTQTQIR